MFFTFPVVSLATVGQATLKLPFGLWAVRVVAMSRTVSVIMLNSKLRVFVIEDQKLKAVASNDRSMTIGPSSSLIK